MRSFRLAVRLAWCNLRRRPAQAVLLLLTLTLATAMFGTGMALYGSADRPWDRVWAATDGFHVSAAYYRDRDVDRTDVDLDAARARFAELAAAPRSGPSADPGPTSTGSSTWTAAARTSPPRSATPAAPPSINRW
jgi:hypothetical protein